MAVCEQVPIYAVESWMALRYRTYAQYWETLREWYVRGSTAGCSPLAATESVGVRLHVVQVLGARCRAVRGTHVRNCVAYLPPSFELNLSTQL